MEKHSITYEDRRLSIGDFAWICRDKINGNEIVLPYIIERKRMDDFAKSIRDGRYGEQKFRLIKSGIENLIYMIESSGNTQMLGLPLETVLQAAVNTQVHSSFYIQFTETNYDSGLYLAILTRKLISLFSNKTLISCLKEDVKKFDPKSTVCNLMSFNEFNINASKTKNLTVRDIFLKQLVKLKSLSVEMAQAIVANYPTPRCLIDAYECISADEGEKLLANIKINTMGRLVGQKFSKIIYNFYTKK